MAIHTFNYDKKLRLDIFLAEEYPAISRSFLKKLCSEDQVLVNNNPEKGGYKLSPGSTVEVLYNMASIDEIDDIDLPILYEDDDVVVIDKPAGVISHARGRYWNEPSVASFVRQLTGLDGERAGIVHRLDRATSGVMICAKTAHAMAYLQKQFADRTVVKKYSAIVSGHLKPKKAVIDMAIERNPKLPSTFRVGPNGKPSQTMYEVVSSSLHYDHVEMLPKTGRTHQLRVHLRYADHPIVGDTLYKGEKASRLFLHAHSLELMLPTGEKKKFVSQIPDEFQEILNTDT